MASGLFGFKGEVSEYDLETFRWKGTWNSNNQYQIDDRVFYNGASYIAIKGSQNQVPFSGVINSEFWNYLAQQGSTGATGSAGAAGTNGSNGTAGTGIRYTFSTTTSSPASTGQIRFNNATYSSVTQIYVHETDRTSGGIASALGQISDGSVLMVFDELDSSKYGFFTLTNQVDNGSDRTLNVSYLAHSGTFTNSSAVSLGFAIRGATGSTGPTGSTGSAGQAGFGIRYTFNTTTSGPPASGQIRFNNGTIASVTQLFLHESDRNSAAISTVLANIPDGSSLIVFDESNSANYAFFSLTSQTDNGSDRTLTVTYLGHNGSFSNGASVSLGFAQRGSTGSTGATGSVSAASGLVLDNSTAPSTSGTQTAIYSASGVPTVRLISNGSSYGISLQGKQTIYIPAVAISPRSTNGCAAIATTALTTGRPEIRHLAFDAATIEYAQFEIDLPKSWNNGTVTAQFVWTGIATGSGDVIWGIQGVAQSDDDTIDAAFGTAVTVTDAFITTNDRHITSESSAMTIAGTPATGDSICFQVYRDATNGSDTRAADANLLGVRLFFTTDKGNDV
jgi:hypothetical protein